MQNFISMSKIKKKTIIIFIASFVGIAIYFVVSRKIKVSSIPKDSIFADNRYIIHKGKDEMGVDVTGYGVNIPTTSKELEKPQYNISDSIHNFPLYPNAISTGKLTWDTSDSTKQVMHWYLLALDDLGWEAETIVDNSDSSEEQSMVLTRGLQKLKLTVTKNSQITTINAEIL